MLQDILTTKKCLFTTGAHTELRGQKNRNRPKSILQALTSDHDNENEAFTTPEDFKEAWERIVRSSHAE